MDKQNERKDNIKDFSFSTINDFDKHILNSIQNYDILDQSIISLAKYFLEDNTNCYDIGCSTGRMIKKLSETYNEKVQYYGIEKNLNFSKNFVDSENIHFLNLDLTKNINFENSSLILSIFTLQFISQKFRQNIINNIYQGLNKGSAFIWAEKVHSSHTKVQDILTFQYYDYKLQSFTAESILDKENNLRNQMKPLSLDENIEILKNAGFTTIDTFWKQYNFVALIAIK